MIGTVTITYGKSMNRADILTALRDCIFQEDLHMSKTVIIKNGGNMNQDGHSQTEDNHTKNRQLLN